MQPAPLLAEAAAASSVETAAAIDRAAEQNEDPEVGSMLEDAALSADATVSVPAFHQPVSTDSPRCCACPRHVSVWSVPNRPTQRLVTPSRSSWNAHPGSGSTAGALIGGSAAGDIGTPRNRCQAEATAIPIAAPLTTSRGRWAPT
jgi:hypothetical protein